MGHPPAIALGLKNAIQTADSSFLTATINPQNSNEIMMTSTSTGPSTDWFPQVSIVDTNGNFNPTSFTVNSDGMFGGDNGVIYSYYVPAEGYTPNSNLIAAQDSVMGNWQYGYDTLNRLKSATAYTGPNAGQTGCWYYDSFGNRQEEVFSTSSPCPSTTSSPTFAYTANNQIDTTKYSGTAYIYDAAGNVTKDATNSQYFYDNEGRICAVENANNSYWEYVYDAEGNRVARGALNSAITSCGTAPTYASFQSNNLYLYLNSGGQQVTELQYTTTNGAVWQHTNTFADGLLATYATTTSGIPFAFHLKDPLGTRRVLADATGKVQQSCQSLPYGNGESCAPTPTEHLFTQKEHDNESGNDYFGARYYSSVVGRWMSPDPSGLAYASQSDPQSLNHYSYVRNSPLILIDPYGLYWKCDQQSSSGTTFLATSDEPVLHPSSSDDGGQESTPGQHCTWIEDVQVTADPNSALELPIPDSGTLTTRAFPLDKGSLYEGPTYSRGQVCSASAAYKSGISLFGDILGTIPGGGNFIKGVQLAAGIGSAYMSARDTSGTTSDQITGGGLAGGGLGLTLAGRGGASWGKWDIVTKPFGEAASSIGLSPARVGGLLPDALEALPIAGNVLSLISAVRDYNQMMDHYNKCMSGKDD